MKNVTQLHLSIIDSAGKDHLLHADGANLNAIDALKEVAIFLGRVLSSEDRSKVEAMLTEESVALTNRAASISTGPVGAIAGHPAVHDFGRTVKQ